MSASNQLKEFIVDYLRIQSFRTPDLNRLKDLCKDTAPKHIIRIIRGCTRHNIRYELKDTPESLREDWKDENRTCLHMAAEDEDFEMISILFDKLSDEDQLRLLRINTDKAGSVSWLSMRYGGFTWAMELAKSATHEALKTEIYGEVLVYTCQNDDAQALQLLLGAVTSDTLMSLLSTLTMGAEYHSCIQEAAYRGINTFISMLSQHLPSDSVLSLLLEQCEGDGGRTALHIACDRKKLKVIETVIGLVPIENRLRLIIAADDDGNTVLHAAVASGDKSCVLALKIDQLTREQQYAVMVKENKDGLKAIDVAKEQKNKQLEGFFDNRLQQSSIRKCDE